MKKKTAYLAGMLGVLAVGAVAVASNAGMLQGRFDTSDPVTRGEFVREVVTLALGEQTETCGMYVDVPEDSEYNPYVCAATEYGIMSAYEGGTFGLDDTMTRAEGAKVVYTAFGLNYECDLPQLYRDVADSTWYFEYVNQLGIQQLFMPEVKLGGSFRPDGSLTENALDLWLENVMAL